MDDYKEEIRNIMFHEIKKLFSKPAVFTNKEIRIIKNSKQN